MRIFSLLPFVFKQTNVEMCGNNPLNKSSNLFNLYDLIPAAFYAIVLPFYCNYLYVRARYLMLIRLLA